MDTLQRRQPMRYLALMTLHPASFAESVRDSRLDAVRAGDSEDGSGLGDGEGQIGIATRTRAKAKKPSLYKVLLLNDDYTTMEFVVLVLEEVFQKSPAEAFRIMMQVHVNGRGLAGIYPWEVAETKAETVISMARDAGFPLKAVTEEA